MTKSKIAALVATASLSIFAASCSTATNEPSRRRALRRRRRPPSGGPRLDHPALEERIEVNSRHPVMRLLVDDLGLAEDNAVA